MKYYIDSQIILGRKIAPLIYVYIMIIIVIALSLIIFLTLFHYRTYYKVKGVVEKVDDDYYIRVYFLLDDVNYLSDNEYKYQSILLKINIPSKYMFNNLCLNLQFIKDEKRVIDYIMRW